MKKLSIIMTILLSITALLAFSDIKGGDVEMDTFAIGDDSLTIHFYGHGSLMMDYNGQRVYVDPVSSYADYSALPDADIILITHEHGDHLDTAAIGQIRQDDTAVISNAKSAKKIKNAIIMHNGDKREEHDILIEAVPAYNTTPSRKMFHPKGNGNGYVVTFGDKRIYVAGDTEDIPEMKDLGDIYIAFLPVNQPYTMKIKQAAHAARVIKPEILYPYHFGKTDILKLKEMLNKEKNIDVRIRHME